MNAFKRLMVFAPRGYVIAFGLLVFVGTAGGVAGVVRGSKIAVGFAAILTAFIGYCLFTIARGRLQHRRLLKLRNLVRRQLKRLKVYDDLDLETSDGQTLLCCQRYGMVVHGYIVVVQEPLEDDVSLYRVQTFDFRPLVQYVLYDIAIEPAGIDTNEAADEKQPSRRAVMRQNWRRMRDMSAEFANQQELEKLLALLATAMPLPE